MSVGYDAGTTTSGENDNHSSIVTATDDEYLFQQIYNPNTMRIPHRAMVAPAIACV